MPQIAPITLGSKTFGSPRTVKSGNAVLFLNLDTVNGAVGDQKLYIGEEPFSSTRASRKSSIRIEMPKVATDSSNGTTSVVGNASIELILSHDRNITEAELLTLRDLMAAAITDMSYPDEVVFKRQGQY